MKNQKSMKRLKVLTYNNKGVRTNFSLVIEIEEKQIIGTKLKKHYLTFAKTFFCKSIASIKIIKYVKYKKGN